MRKMKIKMVDFLFQGILYLICATYCILLPHFLKSVSVSLSTRGASSLSTPILTYGFTGMRSELYPAFPQTLDVTNLAIFNTGFSILLHTTRIVWQFQDFLIHREIWRPNRETVS